MIKKSNNTINRSAVDVIKGYFYQFDLTILEILKLDSDDKFVEVEKIEDIDIKSAKETTAIQCKYYSKTDYNHSIVAKPIRFMLNDFINRKKNREEIIKYKLYGKFRSNQNKLNFPISVEFLKKHFLTFKDKDGAHVYYKEKKISDDNLDEFLKLLTIDINALDYDEQKEIIINKLKNSFKCNDFEAENYYYNNALSLIRILATNESEDDRKINKKLFLNRINKKELLFNTWFIELKGEKEYFKMIKDKYFKLSLNTSPFERFFLLEVDDTSDYLCLKEVILLIQKKWSKISARDKNSFVPYFHIFNIHKKFLLGLKTNLRDEGYYLIDGHDFKDSTFSAKSILKQATFENGIKFKIIDKSSDINKVLLETNKTKEVYQFYLTRPIEISKSLKNTKHVKIQVRKIEDIKECIK